MHNIIQMIFFFLILFCLIFPCIFFNSFLDYDNVKRNNRNDSMDVNSVFD